MKCANCGHQINPVKSRYCINRSGYQLCLEGVAAFGCGVCGARYFPEAEVDAIQEMVADIERDFKKVLAVAG